MAKFRMVHTEFWNDPNVIEEMTPEDKYFFLYLLTNPNTRQVGIYQITKKQMAFDMGYSMETINSLLDRFLNHHKLIKYNENTREIAIKNWGKYNLRRGGKPMLDCVTSELKDVKDKTLIFYVGKQVDNKSIKKIYDSYNEVKKQEKDDSNNGSYDTSTSRGTYRPQYKEKDKEEDKDKEKEIKNKHIRALFEHYLSKNIIRHRKFTDTMRRSANARLRDYSFEELKKGIDNYAKILHSDNHWFTHKYPFADLMREKDITRFLDEADPLNNFLKKNNTGSNNQQQSSEIIPDWFKEQQSQQAPVDEKEKAEVLSLLQRHVNE